MEVQKLIRPFLDEEGKIKEWPMKKAKQRAILAYLAQDFEEGCDYTEKEVNEKIGDKHTFGDFYLLRRELIDAGMMSRTNNGSRYWKEKNPASQK